MAKRGSSRGGGKQSGGKSGGGSKGGSGSKSGASGANPNWPSKTRNPSGPRRGNAPPKSGRQ